MTKAKAFDPLEGVTPKTTKDELVDRLRKAATALRKGDRQRKATLQEIEDRLRAKAAGGDNADLMQVVGVASAAEWADAIEFLEEFEDDGLLPVALERFLVGGRTLLGLIGEQV